jgi:glycerol-3-phosphate dehydrogenase
LWIYDLLAGSRQPVARHLYLRPAEAKRRWPFLREKGLRAAFSYGDCVTDDARLVLEIIAGAIEAGAVAVNYAKYQGEHLVSDELNKEGSVKVGAPVVLACTGPWCGEISTSVAAAARLVMGAHLVMPRMECDEAFLLTADDGRVFFLIPWYGRTLLGTTESDYHADPSDAEAREQDIEYLLRNANSAFFGLEWTRADVISCFAGLRTLRNEQGKASSISRDWKLAEPEPGLLVPIGGKLTSARADAAKMIEAVFKSLKRSTPPCATEERLFPWCPSIDWPDFLLGCLNRALKLGLDPECAQSMAGRYGQRVEKVFALIEAQPKLAARIIEELPFCQAELEFCAQYEMAQTTEDVLRRRVPLQLLVRSEQLVQLHRQVAGHFGV